MESKSEAEILELAPSKYKFHNMTAMSNYFPHEQFFKQELKKEKNLSDLRIKT